MYMHTYVCMYIYVYIHIHIYTYICVYMHIYIYICMYVCMYVCMYLYKYIYMCVCGVCVYIYYIYDHYHICHNYSWIMQAMRAATKCCWYPSCPCLLNRWQSILGNPINQSMLIDKISQLTSMANRWPLNNHKKTFVNPIDYRWS